MGTPPFMKLMYDSLIDYLKENHSSGLLTNKQREKLSNPPEKSTRKWRQIRQRIRRRVYLMLRFDGHILLNHLQKEDREKIFNNWKQNIDSTEDTKLLAIENILSDGSEITDMSDLVRDEMVEKMSEEGSSVEAQLVAESEVSKLESIDAPNFRKGIQDLLCFIFLGVHSTEVGSVEDIVENALNCFVDRVGLELTECHIKLSESNHDDQ